jgi:hypothetical protein
MARLIKAIKVNRQVISEANKITNKYSKWIYPKELQNMYDELNAIGITVGLITNDNTSCEWYYNGELVDNSLFCYSVYKSTQHEGKAEYNIYFS